MKILFLITARGGSKGIPDKNLQEIGGISLIGFRAISARKSAHCDRLMISTDCDRIQAEASRHGVEVAFTRPAELARDDSPSSVVIEHAMNWIEAETDETYDAILLLEPSSPFARPDDYDRAVKMMERHDASAVVGIREIEVSSVYVAPLGEEGRLTPLIDQIRASETGRRQEMTKDYTACGGLYLFRWGYFKKHKDIYYDRKQTFGCLIEDPYSLEIDTPRDLAWARFLVEHGDVDVTHWM